MSITELGIEGEKKARLFLKKHAFIIFQADWMAYKSGQYVMFEVKNKERFMPPPYEGHGLDIRQISARLKFQGETNIRCILLVFEKNTQEIFYQYLDILEAGDSYDTKNGVRIYPLTNFLQGTN